MAIPLLKEIIRRHLPVHFHCPNGLHLREITSEVSMLLFKAGFETIQFGFETSDPLRQGMMGGKVDKRNWKKPRIIYDVLVIEMTILASTFFAVFPDSLRVR